MKINLLRSLTCCLLLVFAIGAQLRADRDADLRNESVPTAYKVRLPLHKHEGPAPASVSSGGKAIPFDSSSPTGNGYTPQQMRHAYGFDQLGTTGEGQIIAIVDPFNSPTIQADLDTFCKAFNIPSTTVRVYYPEGQPPEDEDWGGEISLDVEWAHAIAPGATIVLVVAQSDSPADMFPAIDYAVSLGAKQVSLSWGVDEYSTEGSSDFHFNVPGVTFLAASGDFGAGVGYPSCSPYVVGVGGTTLNLDSSGNYISETGWADSGGGTSLDEPIPGYQAAWLSGTARGVPDVAYDADSNTGIPVYDSLQGWYEVGGTSMAAPSWAALFALANSLSSQPISAAPSSLYALANANYAGYYHDITSGSNGSYSAGPGYDLVTGLGSPIANQLVPALAGGFSSQVAGPVFFPSAGTYASAQTVTILSATPGTSIRYTTDGSTPTATSGTLYSSPVSIGAASTLKAIAYESGLTNSPVTSGGYTFLPPIAALTFSPAAGTYTSAQTVTISTATSGVAIRYTTDGSTPTATSGTLYSGPVSIGNTAILNAFAYESGFVSSPVADGTYAIVPVDVLYNFTAANNGGIYPDAVLVQGSDGNLYGTTNSGGTGNYGTVFKLTSAGVPTTLVSFNSPTNLQFNSAALVQGSDGNFYGTTALGGSSGEGSVFKLTPAGVLTNLVSFNGANGYEPAAALVQGSDGNFYGMTQGGGSIGAGTVFKMTPQGVLTTLVSFTGANGSDPQAGLVQGSDGNFYGTTALGGSSNDGTIFRMTPAGVLTTLVSFNMTNGYYPMATLVQGSDGNFYGITKDGGSSYDPDSDNNGYGTVFKMTPAGALTTLVSFDINKGAWPEAALVQGSDGNFYGTTAYGGWSFGGTVFKMTPAGVLTTLVSYGCVGLVQGGNGNLYGTTEGGGLYGVGTFFQLILPSRSLTGSSGNGFHALAMASTQTGTFTAIFNATPSVSPENSVVGLSKGAATSYGALSCIARFNPSGDIDAYNKTGYAAASKIPYKAGVTYSFRLVVNVSANTYSVYVTPPGASELTVGLNYGFRTKQTSLDTWNLEVDATPAKCSLTATNLNP